MPFQQKIIKDMKIKEALFKLNDFCNANRIEYMVTGTTALAMLGRCKDKEYMLNLIANLVSL